MFWDKKKVVKDQLCKAGIESIISFAYKARVD